MRCLSMNLSWIAHNFQHEYSNRAYTFICMEIHTHFYSTWIKLLLLIHFHLDATQRARTTARIMARTIVVDKIYAIKAPIVQYKISVECDDVNSDEIEWGLTQYKSIFMVMMIVKCYVIIKFNFHIF